MEQNIKYSIIIPHKNSPDLLKRCLESIPDRTDIQVVVVDDNSSSAIIDWNLERANFKGNVELVLTKEGLGAGFARNKGLTYIKGKWVLFADADDYYQSHTFDVLDRQLTENMIFYTLILLLMSLERLAELMVSIDVMKKLW